MGMINNKDADQNVQMHMLFYIFAIYSFEITTKNTS